MRVDLRQFGQGKGDGTRADEFVIEGGLRGHGLVWQRPFVLGCLGGIFTTFFISKRAWGG